MFVIKSKYTKYLLLVLAILFLFCVISYNLYIAPTFLILFLLGIALILLIFASFRTTGYKKYRLILLFISILFFFFVVPVIPMALEFSFSKYTEGKYNRDYPDDIYNYTFLYNKDNKGMTCKSNIKFDPYGDQRFFSYSCKTTINKPFYHRCAERGLTKRCFWRSGFILMFGRSGMFNFNTKGGCEWFEYDYDKNAFQAEEIVIKNGCRDEVYYSFTPKITGDFLITISDKNGYGSTTMKIKVTE